MIAPTPTEAAVQVIENLRQMEIKLEDCSDLILDFYNRAINIVRTWTEPTYQDINNLVKEYYNVTVYTGLYGEGYGDTYSTIDLIEGLCEAFNVNEFIESLCEELDVEHLERTA